MIMESQASFPGLGKEHQGRHSVGHKPVRNVPPAQIAFPDPIMEAPGIGSISLEDAKKEERMGEILIVLRSMPDKTVPGFIKRTKEGIGEDFDRIGYEKGADLHYVDEKGDIHVVEGVTRDELNKAEYIRKEAAKKTKTEKSKENERKKSQKELEGLAPDRKDN